MENIHKIIIVCLVAVILALGVAIGFTLMKEPVKTVSDRKEHYNNRY